MLTCALCGSEHHSLERHLIDHHQISAEEYLQDHPGPLVSDALKERMDKEFTEATEDQGYQRVAPTLSDMKTTIEGLIFNIHRDVDPSACLPLPHHYRFPQEGLLADDIQETLIALYNQRSIFVHGPPGTGKDAIFYAWSALTRTPAVVLGMQPGTDVQDWFYTRAFNAEGTYYETGHLFECATQGYKTEDGRTVPYLILISDIDRADEMQLETFRMSLDSISQRIIGPRGKPHKILDGTIIVATANTSGGGDDTGRYVSSNPIDSSIMDRFQRCFEYHHMVWADEEKIVLKKFPLLAEHSPEMFKQVGKAVSALRTAVVQGSLYADISHRTVCAWLGHAEDIRRATGNAPRDLLRRSARAWLDKLPDKTVKKDAERIIDPHVPGGMFTKVKSQGVRREVRA